MKRNLISALLCCAVILTALSACGSDGAAPAGETPSSSQPPSSAPTASSQPETVSLDVMYIPLDNGGALYFTQSDSSEELMVLRLPEDLRDESGEPITQEDLNRGDVLRLYFSQGYSVNETWPGQLATEADYAEVLHRGKPEDADKYQDAVDSFYQPDPLRIPYLQFTHIEGIAACGGSMGPETESYEWDCTDEAGKPVHLSHQADHPLLRDDLPQLSFSGPSPLELQVEKDVLEWEVCRWDVSQKGDESLPDGKPVTLVPGSVTAAGI